MIISETPHAGEAPSGTQARSSDKPIATVVATFVLATTATTAGERAATAALTATKNYTRNSDCSGFCSDPHAGVELNRQKYPCLQFCNIGSSTWLVVALTACRSKGIR
jgi:hypothetical protein